MPHPPVLIESWLPIEVIGAESLRDASAARKPPLNRLHVWWARRPLTVSRATILGGVLPAWAADWPKDLQEQFPTEQAYQSWFLRFLGIMGDPVAGKKLIRYASEKGETLKANPYGYARAFTVNPSTDDLKIFDKLTSFAWGKSRLNMLDPFSGGGSIPFEALRYGFETFANDLNPVASVILKATLDFPARFGVSLADELAKWGAEWGRRVRTRLEPYFPKQQNENIFAYLWARSVACPSTGKPVPLSPNWWLRTEGTPAAVRLVAEPHMQEPRFEIVTGARAHAANPEVGTISRGVARSPWTGETIDGEYIKAEAQAGRMGQMLYAVVQKVRGGFDFRTPTDTDRQAANGAESDYLKLKDGWLAKDLLPAESIPIGNKTDEPRRYGEYQWTDSFSPRQLASLVTYQESLADLGREIQTNLSDPALARAVQTYLALALDKAAIYNNRHCRFDPGRGIRSIFDRHDFAFVWSHAEFDASANLLPWVVDQVVDAYSEMAGLIAPEQKSIFQNSIPKSPVNITNGSATSLNALDDKSISSITTDPPYYDNVMYAELADFFYVWLKRSVGHLFPEFFTDELTNKDDEAVANPARFEGMGKNKKALAEQDYERKMAAAFREMHRVLRDDGVLTVMFTHKKTEAWDTLASALIGAGFAIKASWPIHTESEHSLHQAKKNAAASTILLVCRKRAAGSADQAPVWWEDIQEQVRATARHKAEEFAQAGIHGVDLYLSTFGPTLSIISAHWPVLTSEVDAKTGQPKPLRPETALNLAREEVVRLRKQGLLLGRQAAFDPVTDWYLMAWDSFGAQEFPYDEGRKLAVALGIDLDGLIIAQKRLASKKGGFIALQPPTARRKKGMVDDEISAFPAWIDAAHTAMMVYSEDGPGACDAFLLRAGLKRDATFKALLQALLNAIPRSRIKGQYVREEAETLENMRLAFFDELAAPVEDEPELPQVRQMGLWESTDENEDE